MPHNVDLISRGELPLNLAISQIETGYVANPSIQRTNTIIYLYRLPLE